MDLGELGCEDVDGEWSYLAQDMLLWQAVLNTVMKV
jgi:hypothetical protein